MTDKQKVELAVKAIRAYASEHFGRSAKYHPEDFVKWKSLMEFADKLERDGEK